MSKFDENYTKLNDGYIKIKDTISSAESIEHLDCVQNMVSSWVNLTEKYCDEVFYDKSIGSRRIRNRYADQLAETASVMFEDLKNLYQQYAQEIMPKEYEGSFSPLRVKNLSEMI